MGRREYEQALDLAAEYLEENCAGLEEEIKSIVAEDGDREFCDTIDLVNGVALSFKRFFAEHGFKESGGPYADSDLGIATMEKDGVVVELDIVGWNYPCYNGYTLRDVYEREGLVIGIDVFDRRTGGEAFLSCVDY